MGELHIVYGPQRSGKSDFIKGNFLVDRSIPWHEFKSDFSSIIKLIDECSLTHILIYDFFIEDFKDKKGLINTLKNKCKCLIIEVQTLKIDTDFILAEFGSAYYHELFSKKVYDLVSPQHYKTFSKETIDMMIDIWGPEAVILYCEMTAFKYRMRIGNKPDQDIKVELDKAKWYESKAIELKQKINQ